MANHSLPTLMSLYPDILSNLKDRIDDNLKMLDSVNTTPTNVPTNAVRFNSTTFLWEKYNGTAWVSLASLYGISVQKATNLIGGNATTLKGAMPYQSNTDVTTLIAPNITTTRKFLRMTGTGTNGAVPVWDAILAADIPTLNQNTTGSAAKLTTPRTINGVSFDGGSNINIEDRLGTAIASAATTTIGTVGLGDTIHITGTTTITSLGVSVTGVRRTIVFDGALTLTNNATSLKLPAGLSIATAAGDVAEFVCENGASGYWRCVSYVPYGISVSEMQYLDGVTSNIQTQFSNKAPLESPEFSGNPKAPTPENGNNSTEIATTEYVLKNSLYEFIRTYTLTNLNTGFPVMDADFTNYSSVHIIPSKTLADGAFKSFSWTIPNHAVENSRDNTGTTTTTLSLYSLNPLTVTKDNAGNYFFYSNGIAGGKEYKKYTNISTPVVLNNLVATNFNSMSGQSVDVYGVRKNTFYI